MKSSVSDLGERGVIELIWSIMEKDGHLSGQVLPPSDDASAILLNDGSYLVLKADMFVKMTDAPRGMLPFQMGAKAVTMNVSDLAAKGARPSAFLFSLGLPRNYPQENLRALISGISSAAKGYGAQVLGGDVGEARDLIISGFVVGSTRNLIKRSGASPGDLVAVTGHFGSTAAAYKILLEGLRAPRSLRRALCRSVYEPRAKPLLGVALAESGAITSSMDSSDGLAFTLNELSKSSRVSFRITNIPISREACEFASIHNISPEDLALYGGEEYELVVTVRRGGWEEAVRLSLIHL
ncbi:MAG: thiamine-phosphate kinase [Candidatus Verstraetearchaeota archaeon]|nr:thiamine-phosphate kinase [Candidatus Verstraetearchaeota archaeon]